MSSSVRKGVTASLNLDKVGGEKVTIILKEIITIKDNTGVSSVLTSRHGALRSRLSPKSLEEEEIETET